MLLPKKVKFRKWQTMRVNPKKAKTATRGTELAFGNFGLKAETAGRVRSNQLEAGRKTIARQMHKTGKLWIRVFPDMPYTAKAAEVGMGKGKGDPKHYVFEVRPGRILFEYDGVPEDIARAHLRQAGMKLPVKVSIVKSR